MRKMKGDLERCSEEMGDIRSPMQLGARRNGVIRRLAKDNRFSLNLPPSMLTVRQWASLFDFMVRLVPQGRWPHAKRRTRREIRG